MPESLITKNLDLWTSAIEAKSTAGRGSGNKFDLYGVKKLRELILALAVRGKLVAQNINEEPARFLLEKIKKKYNKTLSNISEDNYPYIIPYSWEWANLTDVYLSISPSNKKTKTSEILSSGKHPVVDQGMNFISGYSDSDDLLIKINEPVVVFGDHTRNIKYIDFDFVAGADGVKILQPIEIEPRYFLLQLKSYEIDSRGYGRHFKILNSNLFSVPPLAEQERIVTKVDELMALCDQLEQQTVTSMEAHTTLVETLLATLTASADADELAQNWNRISEHFDTLFTTEQSIDLLKQTILQLAVMGKLLPQDPTDEPASVLLEKIAAEKAQLIKDKKIKKEKPLPPISDDEKPFKLPQGWDWCRLNDFTLSSEAGWSPQCDPTPRIGENWGVLKVSAVTWGKFKSEENKALPKELSPKIQYEIEGGDFLISRANTADLVAKSVVVPADAPLHLMMSDKIIRFKFSRRINAEYINLINNSSFSRNYYALVAGGTSSSMKNVSRDQIRNLVIALPPHNEASLILEKYHTFVNVCENLKLKLNITQKLNLRLTDSIINGVLN